MPHPQLDNPTPLVVEPLYLEDESGRPTLTVVVKATFDILTRTRELRLADEQRPLDTAGTFWGEDEGADPAASSYRFEPEVAPLKVATDVAVVGHAHAPKPGTTVMDVGVRVGPLSRGVRVFGERLWYAAGGGANALTRPRAFERIPLCYERAFGGWDRSLPDPEHHVCERRNTVGRGFHHARTAPSSEDFAPNIEDPAALIAGYRDRPAPAGLGFTLPGWVPRTKLAGTYDAAWESSRKPRLPADFDKRFYSGASAGLTSRGFLRGDESVQVVGMRPEGGLSLQLPGIPPPQVRISVMGRADELPALALDTVILDLDAVQLVQLWRTRIRIPEGPADVRVIEILSEAASRFPRADGAVA